MQCVFEEWQLGKADAVGCEVGKLEEPAQGPVESGSGYLPIYLPYQPSTYVYSATTRHRMGMPKRLPEQCLPMRLRRIRFV